MRACVTECLFENERETNRLSLPRLYFRNGIFMARRWNVSGNISYRIDARDDTDRNECFESIVNDVIVVMQA